MRKRRFWFGLTAGLALILVGSLVSGEEQAGKEQEALHLTVSQKEFLCLEPILVTVRVNGAHLHGLPAAPGESKLMGTLRFEIEPAVKPRSGAKPLPLEGDMPGGPVQTRHYDLLEWFAFPDKGGPWTVRATFEDNSVKLISAPITVTLRKPVPKEAEHEPMARLHHLPWSNYDTNAFCGDTFDLVQKWPTSRFAPHCHYRNGRHLQLKKEYDKAIASYRTVLEKYPDFALAGDAEYGIVECLVAQKKLSEAQKLNTALRQKLAEQAAKAGITPGTGQTVVQRLAQDMTQRIDRDLGLK